MTNATLDILLSETPYPGLRPFVESESYLFFGREGQVEALMSKLQRSNFVAVVGASGCGKSSLVKAGLIPELKLEGANNISDWNIIEMRPGNSPYQNFAVSLQAAFPHDDNTKEYIYAELRRSPKGLFNFLSSEVKGKKGNILIIIDQFEELFRHKQNNNIDEVEAFVALLIETIKQQVPNLYFVITMRSDKLGDCTLFTGLSEVVNDNQFLTPQLTRETCREAIMYPPRVFDGEIDPLALNTLLNDLGNNHDQLPIMQHALMRMWSNHQSRAAAGNEPAKFTIDLDDYVAIGTLSKAISQHGDIIYKSLTPDEQIIAKVLFSCLTEKDAEQNSTRRLARVSEVAGISGYSTDDVLKVVAKFRESQFIISPNSAAMDEGAYLDISHESLMRQWELIKDWMTGEYESAKEYKRLLDNAVKYENNRSELLTGIDLKDARKWLRDKKHNIYWAERYTDQEHKLTGFNKVVEYINKSAERKKMRDYGLAIGFVILPLIIIFTVVLQARTSALRNQALSFVAAGRALQSNPTLGYELINRGYNIDKSNKELKAYCDTLSKRKNYACLSAVFSSPDKVVGIRFGANQQVIVVRESSVATFDRNGLIVKNLLLGGTVLFSDVHKGFILLRKNSLDPTHIGKLEIRDLDTNLIAVLPPTNDIAHFAIAKDGSHFCVNDSLYVRGKMHSKHAIAWNLQDRITSIAYANDKAHSLICGLSYNSGIIIYDTMGHVVRQFVNIDRQYAEVSAIKLSPDGKKFVAVYPGAMDIWELGNLDSAIQNRSATKNGDTVFKARTVLTDGTPTIVDVSSQDQIIYAIGASAVILDISGKKVSTLVGNLYDINLVAFSEDGNEIVTNNYVNKIYLWNTATLEASYNAGKLARFSPYTYRSIGLKKYNKENIYGTPASINTIFGNVLNYHSSLPFSNDFPGDYDYKETLDSSVGDIETMYNDMFANASFATLSLENRKLAYDCYSNFTLQKQALLHPVTLFNLNALSIYSKWLLYKEKSLLLDTAAKQIKAAYDLSKLYCRIAEVYRDTLHMHDSAYKYFKKEIDLLEVYHSKFPGRKFLSHILSEAYTNHAARYIADTGGNFEYKYKNARLYEEKNARLLDGWYKQNPKDSAFRSRMVLVNGRLSWIYLFSDPAKAIVAAKTVLANNSAADDWVYTNLALGYLLTKNFTEAELLYKKYKARSYYDKSKTFKSAFLEDFRDLENAGVINPKDPDVYAEVAKIKAMLK